jgi:N-acyl-phosphatidylethanolamine-hydrolysing phospholipase D
MALAAVPIGAYLSEPMMRPVHLNPEEALRAAIDARARRAIGMHFGTFDLTDEPLEEPPRRFLSGAKHAGLDQKDVWILKVGETRRW